MSLHSIKIGSPVIELSSSLTHIQMAPSKEPNSLLAFRITIPELTAAVRFLCYVRKTNLNVVKSHQPTTVVCLSAMLCDV